MDARQRLTSSSGTRVEFDFDLLDDYASARIAGLLPMILVLAILLAFASLWVPIEIAAAWAGLVALANIAVGFACRQFRRENRQKFNARKWTATFIVGETIYGLAWAALPILTIGGGGQDILIIIFSMLLVGMAANAMSTRTLPQATLVSTLPACLSVGTTLIIAAGTLNFALAAVACGAFFFFLFLAYQLHKSELGNLEHQLEKDGLILDLEEARIMSDEARHHAEQANLAKSRFLATMSHELRTPLTSIIGNAELMELVPQDDNDRHQSLRTIKDSGRHLLNLINELLDLSRFEAGRYDLNEEAIGLADIAADCKRMLEIRARAKNIDLVFDSDEDMPKLWADERSVRQVVLNLLSNAIKFTPQAGKVTVTVGRSTDGGQFVSVTDNGPGIPEEEIETVLSFFGQGSLAQKTAEQGAGLGLPIVQKIMDLHQGRFDLFSKLRFGTKVIATFPRARTGVPSASPSVPPHDIADSPNRSNADELMPLKNADLAPKSDNRFHFAAERIPLNVLVVEDDMSILHIIRSIGQIAGHNISTTTNGEEAILRIKERNFDCILLDMNLPGIQGTEVKGEFDAENGKSVSPPLFFAVTADVSPKQRTMYKAAGFHDVIEKPFDSRDILAAFSETQRTRAEKAYKLDYPHEIDPRRMAALERSLERNDFIESLLHAEASLVSRRAALSEAMQSGNLPSARKICHTIAGTASQYGLIALLDQTERVEMSSKPPAQSLWRL
ncbi:ATP-binding response regulator [Pelagibacterium xiamenense]|uniref:ATP-binding response regulator n=1 Tax=Pelagibacterium xiamenense TaxID=2901140 RepID=UPI001E5D74EE|nr:ATP-binding protein [Pelagibacterium xiamenense]MCD7060129.1 ATP-binding protein [Pelagibacterium xiamenense]